MSSFQAFSSRSKRLIDCFPPLVHLKYDDVKPSLDRREIRHNCKQMKNEPQHHLEKEQPILTTPLQVIVD